MEIEVNEFLTPITLELLDSLSNEAREQFMDYITNVEFIKRLIAPNRKRAKELERRDNRIIVDIVNPHILEDMEYFRPIGNFYRKHGVLTKLRPNPSPNSDYGKWLDTEIDRIWNGMVRESDGEWVTGNMYFYLNYTPIILSKIRKGTKLADRVVDFPECWEGTYLWYHYIDQARNGGIYNNWAGGEHAVQIARRGAGKSYSAAAMLGRAFVCGENELAQKKVKGAVTAYLKEYLVKDGILNKFVDIIDFCAENTLFPASRIKDSINDMHWMMGYKDGISNTNKGTLNEILGISAKDDTDKSRGKRSNMFIYEEFGAFPKFIDIWNVNKSNVLEDDIVFGQAIAFGTGGSEGCLTAGNKVHLSNGSITNVEDLKVTDKLLGFDTDSKKVVEENILYLDNSIKKECIKITTVNNRTIECTLNHPIYSSNKIDCNELRVFNWNNSLDLKVGDLITIPEEIPYFGTETLFDSRAIGLLIGDGSYGEKQNVRIHSCDGEILNYFKEQYPFTILTNYNTKDNKSYQCLTLKGLRNPLRNIGIYGQTKNNKRLPENYSRLNLKDLSLLIAGLFDTDGNINNIFNKKRNKYSTTISLASSCKELLLEVILALLKFGIYATLLIKKPNLNSNKRIKDKEEYYSLEISSKDSIINFANKIPLLIKYKLESLKFAKEIVLSKKSLRKNKEFYTEKIKEIEYVGLKTIYNLTTSGTHTYIANGIITHNSDFSGALEMIYNPIGYLVYPLPNVFDKNSQGKQMTVFFFGAYLNRKGCYNENGVSNVVMALLQEIQARIKIKYNSTDTMTLTRKKAEQAITIQEAVMKRDGTFYPIADLTDVHNELEFNPRELDYIGVGELSLTKDNIIVFKPTTGAIPIREFPHKDNKLLGCVEVHRPPVVDASGKIPHGRYIAGIDPYDDDASDTLSLGSLTILDLFTDLIVFEYVGRPMFADDFYETCRRALIWYNAECNYENNKKGLFKYFSQHNSLYLLSETLDFLKDKELMKPGLYGNKARGTISSAPIKAYGRRCIRDWLLKPVQITQVIDREEVEVTVPALTLMKTKALIKELMLWNPDGNFDRHDSLAMLMLLREERLRVFGVLSPSEALRNTAEDYSGNDRYFTANYDNKFSSKIKHKVPSFFDKQ